SVMENSGAQTPDDEVGKVRAMRGGRTLAAGVSILRRCSGGLAWLGLALGFCGLFWGTGCQRAAEGERVIRVWSHQGQEAENLAMRRIAAAFNEGYADRGIRVDISFFPDFQYTEKLAIAAAARDLPDAFDLDGPLVARLVDANVLAPLDAW